MATRLGKDFFAKTSTVVSENKMHAKEKMKRKRNGKRKSNICFFLCD